MTTNNEEIFKIMEADEAASFAIDARDRLADTDLVEPFATETIGNLHAAIEARRKTGFEVDPTAPAEVSNLVKAVMAENDHVKNALPTLNRYVVGFVQTDEISLRRAVWRAQNGAE